jgi:hypothetical protein
VFVALVPSGFCHSSTAQQGSGTTAWGSTCHGARSQIRQHFNLPTGISSGAPSRLFNLFECLSVALVYLGFGSPSSQQHFNEQAPHLNCQSCDVCLESKVDEHQYPHLMAEVSILLKTIDSQGKVGQAKLIKHAREHELRHMAEKFAKALWRGMEVANLITPQQGSFTGGTYTYYIVSPAGRTFMAQPFAISWTPEMKELSSSSGGADRAISAAASRPPGLAVAFQRPTDEELFETLKAVRKELATNHSVPPYVIYPDKSIRDMVSILPLDRTHLLQCSEMGLRHCDAHADKILPVIQAHVAKHALAGNCAPAAAATAAVAVAVASPLALSPPSIGHLSTASELLYFFGQEVKGSATIDETARLFNNPGRTSLAGIALARGIAERTVIGHLVTAILLKRVDVKDARLAVPEKDEQLIVDCLQSVDIPASKLSDVKAVLPETIGWDQIKLVAAKVMAAGGPVASALPLSVHRESSSASHGGAPPVPTPPLAALPGPTASTAPKVPARLSSVMAAALAKLSPSETDPRDDSYGAVMAVGASSSPGHATGVLPWSFSAAQAAAIPALPVLSTTAPCSALARSPTLLLPPITEVRYFVHFTSCHFTLTRFA